MKHITICEYGQFVGVTSERLIVKEGDTLIAEYPLSRIKTVTITKNGISLSSNVIIKCAMRGIKLFVLDPFSHTLACVSGGQLHAVSKVREQQFKFLETEEAKTLARSIIVGKLKNQRVILQYFSKYQKKQHQSHICQLVASKLKIHIAKVQQLNIEKYDDWRKVLLGYEGSGAAMYWKALHESNLFPESFNGRVGRGAKDPINSALNYGYQILSTYVWHYLINSGLEIYQGVLHMQRAGNPSLVLDMMEPYRSWVVDRNVIKMANKLHAASELTPKIKKELITSIHKTFATHYHYQGKKLKLETILQRQIYLLSGAFYGENQYKPYIFHW